MMGARACFRSGFLVLIFMLTSGRLPAQEVPLEYCDRLPTVQVEVAGRKPMLFLVDTAASSLLNLQSFFLGESREVEITSYRGTANASAREVNLPETRIGSYRLVGVKMLAVDLSALGKNCGRRIDGILGTDLLEKMGATIDFKRRIARFTTSDDKRNDELIAAMKRDLQSCIAAFNAADEKTVAGCLDSEITVFQPNPETYGWKQALGYFHEHYFGPKSGAHLEMRASSFHVIGEAIWFEYDFTLTTQRDTLQVRGLAMCHKLDGHWRVASMDPAVMPAEVPEER
jgi:hypothetical protein